jgi:sulfite oxidase
VGNFYGASIPASRAFDPNSDVILAYEMNGEPLSRDHGFPVRVLVPGVVAARSVKWVQRIVFADEESQSFWQQKDYKGFGPSQEADGADFSKAVSIQEMPVTSAFTLPTSGSVVKAKDGKINVKGSSWTLRCLSR